MQNAATPAQTGAGSAARDTSTPVNKTTLTAQENGEDTDEDEDNGEVQTP